MNKTGPITPNEVAEEHAKGTHIPGEVFEAFNACISKHWNGSSSMFLQSEVVGMIRVRFPDRDPFKERWLDVEDAYRRVGWTVEYDKPGFNESYEASFTFSRRKR